MRKVFQWLINPTKNNLRLSRLLIVAWFLLVSIALCVPITEDSKLAQVEGLDKVVHFGLFFVMSYLITCDIYLRRGDWFKPTYIAIMISGGYAFVGEYLQQFVIGRTSSAADFSAGLSGAIIAVMAYFFFRYHSKQRLLIHICCIGCGAYVSQELKKSYRPTLYFYNPNIFPMEEYDKRLEEIRRVARSFGLKVVVGSNEHDKWMDMVKGRENDPERGKRCSLCIGSRLEEAADFAKKKGFEIFTTTLTVSPHKDAVMISGIGKDLSQRYKLEYLDKDFKKNDGFKKAAELSKRLRLYRQDYCGCEYSIRKQES